MPTAESVLLEYQGKLQSLQVGVSPAHAHHSRAQTLLSLAVGAFVLLLIASARHIAPGWLSLLTLPFVGLGIQNYWRARREVLKTWRLQRFYQAGLERLKGDWAGKGATGEDFGRTSHLYQYDLNLFGAGSMFELLCTARTQVGQRRLASYLLDLPERNETLARQEAVKELQPRWNLREQISLLGKFSFLDCDWDSVREWLDSPVATAPLALVWMLPVISTSLALLVLIPWLARVDAGLWTVVTPYLGPLIVIQAVLAIVLRPRVRSVLDRTRRLENELTLFRQGLALLEAQQFDSAKLKGLVDRAQGGAKAVRKLERLVRGLEECNKQWFFALSRVLLIDTQFALAIERWRATHGKHLLDWLDVWSEFDALNAVACYAHEHPEDVYPEMLDRPPVFDAAALGHPLLPENVGVRNDVCLNSETKFYLVSGSNMAGKSTLLRAIGLNAVLASAGAPVRARRARMSCFAVCASISIVDSLGEGKSKFMAEVERLRETLRSTSDTKPVLFLIDEILSGTNSHDRRFAAESFLRALISAGAIGALSTHDLTLAEIAEIPVLAGVNVHMESRDPADPFAFDYLLKPGVNTHSNGLAIARMAGVAV